jgi:predicted GIY-YIG superfamily endonuclease
MYTVYIHKNKINQKVYVGLTKQSPQARWRVGGHGYKK